jgi:ATP-dependent DNA ligase
MNTEVTHEEVYEVTYEVTVNNRAMKFDKKTYPNYKTYSLPILKSVDKLNRNSYWEIVVTEDSKGVKYNTESWIEDGKHKRSSDVVIENGKNIGKKNETNALEQALFEVYSKFLKKKDQEFKSEEEVVESKDETSGLPMLAQKYQERKKYLVEPFASSYKLDGVRMMSSLTKNKVILRSRTGKEFSNMDAIREQLKYILKDGVVLDGECYSHNISFNEISGATRSKAVSKLEKYLEYWIFDIADPNVTYAKRVEQLKELEAKYNKQNISERKLKFVYYDLITHKDVQAYHDKYISLGYEGVILRNLDSYYVHKVRSNDCQKYKEFEDREFNIVGFKDGKGSEKEAIIFICETDKGEQFDVRPRGAIDSRKDMYKRGDEYIGKRYTVRYQNTEDVKDGVPRFPIGIGVRDYE